MSQGDQNNDLSQNSQGFVEPAEDDIAAHEDLLEDLMNKIDESQETVDTLREQIADTEVEINHIKNDIVQLKKLRQKQAVECTYNGPTPDFDLNQLNPEHRDLINELMDKIYASELEQEKMESSNQNLEAEVDALTRENEELNQKIRQYKSQIKRTKQEHAYVKNSISMTQQKIKESEQTIRMNNQTLKITSAAVNGLVSRQEELETKDGGTTELEKLINSAENEIAIEQLDVDTTEEQIEKAKEAHREVIEKMNSELNSHTSLINWNDEKAGLQAEIEATRNALKSAKEENQERNQKYATLFNRYKLLTPIVKKWCNTDLSNIEDQENTKIHSLLDQLNQTNQQTNVVTDEKNQELEIEKVKNGELEGKIKTLREKLEREMAIFATQEKELKGKIDSQRTKSFEEEHIIVTHMNKIKVKIAQIKNKQ
ncbi:hypothetical protein TRFO_41456 [Tritrichomonas foetus]|uniref:Uncharacterized protein n=1 Tax=Tritrichomonas foetus TaxID=1144522 RepID=A0A1J4L1G0_9EUKA|nr:hypothetical protein TRFO_41456 [Tritrichomonas foetus]|eukprot:OHT16904.1 hypothetical protein TRFO_41456 [Tritrichomonas foetus]